MAARLNKRHDEEARKKIQVSQLINRLQDNALGKLKVQGKPAPELSAGQIKSIEILLGKSLPSLANVTVSGDTENPLKQVIEFSFRSAV